MSFREKAIEGVVTRDAVFEEPIDQLPDLSITYRIAVRTKAGYLASNYMQACADNGVPTFTRNSPEVLQMSLVDHSIYTSIKSN